MALRRKYQKGGVAGVGSTISRIQANQERQRLASIQELWNQFQRNKLAEGMEAASKQDAYAATGSKIGGGLFQLLGNALWGGDDPNYSPELFGLDLNPLLQAGSSLVGAGLGSWGGRELVDLPAAPTFDEFAGEKGIDLSGKYHTGLKSLLKTGAAGDTSAFEDKMAVQTSGDTLSDILGAFSDMAFFGELGSENWLKDIMAMFEPTATSDAWDPESGKKPWEE